MGVILNECPLVSHLSAFDNVALPLRLGGRSEGQVRANVIEMLRWMGLVPKLISLPRDLSDSERQRVLIARAVIGRPRLLLADEPTAALDEYQTERIIHLLLELHRLGSTVIIASHSETLAKRFPGSVMTLSHNTVTETG
jgi:cell division transport system ATP-binding protein